MDYASCGEVEGGGVVLAIESCSAEDERREDRGDWGVGRHGRGAVLDLRSGSTTRVVCYVRILAEAGWREVN